MECYTITGRTTRVLKSANTSAGAFLAAYNYARAFLTPHKLKMTSQEKKINFATSKIKKK